MYMRYTYIIAQQNNLNWLIVSMVCCVLFFIYREYVGIDLVWNADLAILAAAFISLGIVTKHNKSLRKSLESMLTTTASLLLSIICSAYNYKCFEVVDWYSNSFGNIMLFIIASISGVVAIVSFTINTNQYNLVRGGLIYLGRNSLVYYGLHRVIIDMTFVLYNKLGIEIIRGRLDTVLYAIISLITLTPVNILINRYCPMIIGRRKQ